MAWKAIFSAVLFHLAMALSAAAQDNPVATARAAELYGLEPRFGGSANSELERAI